MILIIGFLILSLMWQTFQLRHQSMCSSRLRPLATIVWITQFTISSLKPRTLKLFSLNSRNTEKRTSFQMLQITITDVSVYSSLYLPGLLVLLFIISFFVFALLIPFRVKIQALRWSVLSGSVLPFFVLSNLFADQWADSNLDMNVTQEFRKIP